MVVSSEKIKIKMIKNKNVSLSESKAICSYSPNSDLNSPSSVHSCLQNNWCCKEMNPKYV